MGWWKNFLEKLASANKEELGTKRLDCCELNEQKGTSRPKKEK